jgi:hypothetical protein
MGGRQCDELITVSLEKRITGDGKCTDPLFDERGHPKGLALIGRSTAADSNGSGLQALIIHGISNR